MPVPSLAGRHVCRSTSAARLAVLYDVPHNTCKLQEHVGDVADRAHLARLLPLACLKG
jgi:hypothetical protein